MELDPAPIRLLEAPWVVVGMQLGKTQENVFEGALSKFFDLRPTLLHGGII